MLINLDEIDRRDLSMWMWKVFKELPDEHRFYLGEWVERVKRPPLAELGEEFSTRYINAFPKGHQEKVKSFETLEHLISALNTKGIKISRSNISKVLREERKSTGGFEFHYCYHIMGKLGNGIFTKDITNASYEEQIEFFKECYLRLLPGDIRPFNRKLPVLGKGKPIVLAYDTIDEMMYSFLSVGDFVTYLKKLGHESISPSNVTRAAEHNGVVYGYEIEFDYVKGE